jgi:hypothetical protein
VVDGGCAGHDCCTEHRKPRQQGGVRNALCTFGFAHTRVRCQPVADRSVAIVGVDAVLVHPGDHCGAEQFGSIDQASYSNHICG